MVRRTANGAPQQMGDTFLKNCVRLEADVVKKTFCFQELLDVRCGKGVIPSEVAAQVPFPVTLDDGFENGALAVGALNITGTQGTPLQITDWLNKNSGW
jgi:hypothetical protein